MYQGWKGGSRCSKTIDLLFPFPSLDLPSCPHLGNGRFTLASDFIQGPYLDVYSPSLFLLDPASQFSGQEVFLLLISPFLYWFKELGGNYSHLQILSGRLCRFSRPTPVPQGLAVPIIKLVSLPAAHSSTPSYRSFAAARTSTFS